MTTQPLKTSLHPLTYIESRIQSPNIKEAWVKLIGDKKSPNTMTMAELDGFVRAATHNDGRVPGSDLTPKELADLQLIAREAGPFLFQDDKVSKAYARRLLPYEQKPTVTIAETDPGLDVSRVAINKVAIKGRANGDLCPSGVVCIIGGPTTVTVDIGGQKFAVQPENNESAQSVSRRLEKQLENAGFQASTATHSGRAILSVNGKATLPLSSLTTDKTVHMQVIGNTISINAGIGGPIRFEGGRIGVSLKGQDFVVLTKKGGENISEAFDQLRQKILNAGYDVEVNSPPAIDTFMQAWSISPAKRQAFAANSYAQLNGRLGAADPDGNRTFTLDKQIQVGETLVDSIQVQNAQKWSEGKATLTGRLELQQSMMTVYPPQFFAKMSGATNQSAGEPSYDGADFKNAKGQTLEVLSYDRPNMWDAPSTIFVLDQSTDKAFVGNRGGMRPSEMNPFHGFNSAREIRSATRTDISQVKWHTVSDTGRAREEWPHGQGGEALTQIGGPDTIAGKRWFMDNNSGAVYGFQITGPQARTMEQVIDPPQS